MPYPKRDVTSQRFGRLVVVGDAPKGDRTKHRWVACRCDCGNSVGVRLATLREGRTKSCGCLQRENLAAVHAARQIDLVGRTFGRLTVVAKAPSKKIGRKWFGYWECRCECGAMTIVQRAALTSHATRSCGCYQQETMAIRALKHGGVRWPEYKIWAAIVQRCTNPNNPGYVHYGGRGIKVCDEWRASFEAFIKSVGRRPEPGLQLDRIDNNGNYEPGNMRWITRDENMRNRVFIGRKKAEQLLSELDQYKALHGPLPSES